MTKPRRKPWTVKPTNPIDFLLTNSQQVAAVIFMGLYFQYFVFRTQSLLDAYLEEHSFIKQMRNLEELSAGIENRYLVFQDIAGQGIGNILHGLLAAHMLGLEFNRTVCVSRDWSAFHDAFHTVRQAKECAAIEPRGKQEDSILLLNYNLPPNECQLQSKLASGKPILYLTSNTYPRWSISPQGLWDMHYRPTNRLIKALPYKAQPEIVVHLRKEDNDGADHRRGLDSATLTTLGKLLPNNTFLVTNNVQWYSFFETFGWRNPGWHKIRHSALSEVEWGSADNRKSVNLTAPTSIDVEMQLWSDWYTILRAEHVYHTHSDFSLSAIHWNEIDSKTVNGIDRKTSALLLVDEHWRVETPMPRLVDRRGDELKNCDKSQDDMGSKSGMDDQDGNDDEIRKDHKQ